MRRFMSKGDGEALLGMEPWHPFRSAALKHEYLAFYDARAQRWPMPSESRMVSTALGDTFVRVQGPFDGPPLVLIPGDSETSLSWMPVIEAFASEHRVYAVDHIYDIGRSVYRRQPRRPDEFVGWLDEVLDRLDVHDVRLVAHSYGGWMAALYAFEYPERLERLVLLSPQGVLRPPLGLVPRAILYGTLSWRWLIRRYLYWYAPDCVRNDETRPVIDEMIEEDLLARRCFKINKSEIVRPTVLSDEGWQQLAVPTLFLVGRNEVSYSAERAVERLAAVAPHVKSQITDGDHHLTIVKPDWVIEQVLGFLADGEPPVVPSSGDGDVLDEGGSVAGASLLFAGTAVGAGMIALPAETAGAGFVPSIAGLAICWAFTYITSLVTLEASWLASSKEAEEGSGFLSISRILGVPGEVVTAALFWFLLTAIIVAYTAEGGQLISQFAREVAHTEMPPALGSATFAVFFASLSTYGTARVDAINRFFVFGLVATFLGLVTIGLPMVNTSNLFVRSDWGMVYPPVISIGILSFGAQNVVPTLLRYLDCHVEKTRQSILVGSLLPLLLYTVWEAIFLGVVDVEALDGGKMEVVPVLGQVGGPIVTDLVEAFSLCAIGSSMAGASVSLVDFFEDALGILSPEGDQNDSKGTSGTRVLAAALALGPPVILAYAFQDIFLVALEEAGLLGGVSLYGIIPAVSILALRRLDSTEGAQSQMPGRLGGGNFSLIALIIISSALVLPEIRDILTK